MRNSKVIELEESGFVVGSVVSKPKSTVKKTISFKDERKHHKNV